MIAGRRRVLVAQGVFAVALAAGLPLLAADAPDQGFADEARDFGVPEQSTVRQGSYAGGTPRSIPGGRVVTAVELKAMIDGDRKPFLVDVLSGPPHRSIPGSVWMHNGGLGDFDAAEEQRFLRTIALFTGTDRSRAIVFYCSSAECWLSYNAALRAIQAGYTSVLWFRGGIAAWQAAGFPTARTEPFPW